MKKRNNNEDVLFQYYRALDRWMHDGSYAAFRRVTRAEKALEKAKLETRRRRRKKK